jgi:hypothetical protein
MRPTETVQAARFRVGHGPPGLVPQYVSSRLPLTMHGRRKISLRRPVRLRPPFCHHPHMCHHRSFISSRRLPTKQSFPFLPHSHASALPLAMLLYLVLCNRALRPPELPSCEPRIATEQVLPTPRQVDDRRAPTSSTTSAFLCHGHPVADGRLWLSLPRLLHPRAIERLCAAL